jgi:hypothetical protein
MLPEIQSLMPYRFHGPVFMSEYSIPYVKIQYLLCQNTVFLMSKYSMFLCQNTVSFMPKYGKSLCQNTVFLDPFSLCFRDRLLQ